ncbi:MAG TPA: CHAT domain-containing protein [Pyrinomonadaceae bacterium]|nr:CHAT domain-containing protein [Pyrinomonadaceae bacterium]
MRRKFIFVSFLLLAFNLSAFAFLKDDSFLTVNNTFSAKLSTTETHKFIIKAEENEFVEIICERNGADVGLSVFSPSNEVLSVSNAPSGFAGKDNLVFIAEKSGLYKLEIKSRRPGNFVGNYTIRLKEKRIADENDRLRVKAMQIIGSVRDSIFGTDDRLQKTETALETLKKALEIFEKIEDKRGQAVTLYLIGDIYSNELGLEKPSIEYFEKSLAIWEKSDDFGNLAICLTALANEFRMNGQSEKSEFYFNKAIEINKSINAAHSEGVTLSLFCRLYNDTGFFQKGFEKCRESLKLTKDGDPITDSFTYQVLGALASNTGDFEGSEKFISLAFERIKPVKDLLNPTRFARIQSAVAGNFYNKKEFQKAIENFEQALEISRKANRPLFSAYFLVQLGECYFSLKNFEKAAEYGLESLELNRKFDPRRRQAPLNLLAKTYGELNQPEKAREFSNEAIEMNRQNKDRYAEAECLYELAKIEEKAGNLETAHVYARQAANYMEILRADLLGKNQRSSYNSILKIYYELEIEILVKKYEREPKIEFLEAAWQKQEKIRARSLLENFIEEGLTVNEVVSNDIFLKEKDLLETIASAENKRIEAERSKNRENLKTAEKSLQKALDELETFQEEQRRSNPKFSSLNQIRDFTFADVRQTLSEDSAMLEFSVGTNQTFLWFIKKDSVKLFYLPKREKIDKISLEYYNLLIDKTVQTAKITEKSKELSRIIFSPLKDELSEIKSLIIIPDGSLQLIPFSTLSIDFQTDFHLLTEQFNLVNLPSFSSFAYMREAKSKQTANNEKLLAIIADPIFQFDDERISVKGKTQDSTAFSAAEAEKLAEVLRDFGIDKLSRLPFTNFEAKEIQKFAPNETNLALGENASRQRFLNGDFENYKILHFATHGFLNQKNPDLSGLVLSLYDKKRHPQNGFLRVIDLYSVRLNANLVVLSACQTGLGKDIEGEGIVGLTHGFMFAGASRVVSSLWKVEEAATAELMKRFYREMIVNKQNPASALRIAQNEMRQIPRFKNPRYWAGFTLTGDWQ